MGQFDVLFRALQAYIPGGYEPPLRLRTARRQLVLSTSQMQPGASEVLFVSLSGIYWTGIS